MFRPLLPLLALFFSHLPVDLRGTTDSLFHALDREARNGAMGYSWLLHSTTHIGHRLTGTLQGELAVALADSLFRDMGLSVERHTFEAMAWQRGALQLGLHGLHGTEHLGAVALANTPEEARVRAELIDAGNGLAGDLARLGDAVQGRAVLVNLGLLNAAEGASNLHRSEKTALAVASGAAAVVFVNHVEGGVLLTGTASSDGTAVPVPAVCIASEDGDRLRARLASGEALTVSISMTNSREAVRSANVLATLPGADRADEVIVVGGHLDSWDLASGATDNGLGAFSILDLARCLTAMGHRPSRTIVFALFMGEEQGLLGSGDWVHHLGRLGDLDRVRCMINLDMTGGPFGFNVVGGTGWDDLVRQVSAEIQAVDTAFEGTVDTRAWLHSDHQPFMLRGVPVINPMSDLGGHVYGCYHSSCDDIHLVDPRRMVDNVRYVGMLTLALADAKELPGGLSDDGLRDKLKADGLEEKLRIQREWRW